MMAKNQNTFAKRQREMEKRRKAEDKRKRRRVRKELGDVADDNPMDPMQEDDRNPMQEVDSLLQDEKSDPLTLG